jgi:hypothetical protein
VADRQVPKGTHKRALSVILQSPAAEIRALNSIYEFHSCLPAVSRVEPILVSERSEQPMSRLFSSGFSAIRIISAARSHTGRACRNGSRGPGSGSPRVHQRHEVRAWVAGQHDRVGELAREVEAFAVMRCG